MHLTEMEKNTGNLNCEGGAIFLLLLLACN